MKICTRCKVEKSEGEFSKRGYIKKDNTQSLSSWCKLCQSEHGKKYREGKEEFFANRMREAAAKDPEKFRKRSRDWRKKNREKYIASSRKRYRQKDRFRSALETSRRNAKRLGHVPCNATAEELKAAWTGRCGICSVPEIECTRRLALDHSHDGDGDFRGFLCGSCNRMLGYARDSEEILIDAVHYLMQHQHQK